MKRSRTPPNLLILGASGNVARAFLRKLPGQRRRFGRIVLLDQNRRLLTDPYLDLRALRARFIQARLQVPVEAGAYRDLLKRHRISIVMDVTDHDTLPILDVTDAAGASYLNTCLSDERLYVDALVDATFGARGRYRGGPHILCAGMNPGAVNLWVCLGLARHGQPREAVHFEYDTSMTPDRWRPILTWSPAEFIQESAIAPAGLAAGRRTEYYPSNALLRRQPMREVLEPVWKLREYPRGMLVLHEENVLLARRFGLRSRFLYAIDPRTMDHLARLYRSRGSLQTSDFVNGDNVSLRLEGADTIGVMLDYPRRRVYYMNSLANSAVQGTNATCTQVALGIYAALFTLVLDRLPRGVHFVGDLVRTSYRHLLLDNMRVSEHVFEKRGRGRLALVRHEAALGGRAGRSERILV